MAKNSAVSLNDGLRRKILALANEIVDDIDSDRAWGRFTIEIQAEGGKIRTVRRVHDQTFKTGVEELTNGKG